MKLKMDKDILREAREIENEIIHWRRELHQKPEVGTCLPNTVKYIEEELTKMNVSFQTYEEISCIVAQIGQGENCFLLRSDMDALPIREESGEVFAAKNGCMHACGHDMHAAILLGAAKILKRHEDCLKGTVKLLFQSGEENFTGARKAVEAGVLKNPDVKAAMALHVNVEGKANTVCCGLFPMASVYGFKINIIGKGTHGAFPQEGIDPINTAVHIYQALQEMIAREVSAFDQAVLTIGKIQAGTAANIIPEYAELQGTLRVFSPELRKQLMNRISEIVQNVSSVYRTKAEIEVLYDVPSVVCDKELFEEMLKSMKKLDGLEPLATDLRVMGSEDFAVIAEIVPSTHVGLGVQMENIEDRYHQHSPKVRFNEKALALGTAIYVQVAEDWLENHKM